MTDLVKQSYMTCALDPVLHVTLRKHLCVAPIHMFRGAQIPEFYMVAPNMCGSGVWI